MHVLISEFPGRKPYSLNMREQIELTSPRVSILTCYNIHINTSKDERDPTTSEDKNDPIPALIPTRGYPNRAHRAPNCLLVMYLSCYYCIFLHCYLLVYLPPTCNCKLLAFVYHCHLLVFVTFYFMLMYTQVHATYTMLSLYKGLPAPCIERSVLVLCLSYQAEVLRPHITLLLLLS